MAATPLPEPLRLLAPVLNERLGAILVAIQKLIASHFLKDPFREPIIWPLWKRLQRARHCLARVAALIEAGKPLPGSRAGKPQRLASPSPLVGGERAGVRGDSASPAENAPSRARPPSVVPRTRAWLLKALGWHVAVYRTRLETLLAEPGMLDLVRAAPSLGRILRPLCRMLHLPQPCPPPGHRRRTPPSAPRPAPPRREPAAPPGFIPRVAPPPQPPLCDRHVFAWPRQGPDGVLLFRRT